MSYAQPKESDWKKFRTIVPELRERYLRERNSELSALLQDQSLTATEQFWAVSDRIDEVVKILKLCLADHSRSKMFNSLRLMYHHHMKKEEDLDGFSEELRGKLAAVRKLLDE